MNKITKTLETNSLLESQLTPDELFDLSILAYKKSMEMLDLSTFFSRMAIVSGNMEYDIIGSQIDKSYFKYSNLKYGFEQQIIMGKNPKIQIIAYSIKLDSEIKQILNLIRDMDLYSYYLIFTENDRDAGIEQMKFKFNTENQSKTNHLKIVFKKASC